MNYKSNGYLATLLDEAAGNTAHPSYSEATSYIAKFRALEDTFYEKVHPLVDVGLAMSEMTLARRRRPHIFTVHGCRHISDLIKSMDKIAAGISNDRGDPLSILEAYIMLCAAHVHDGANVKQRLGHPERCDELIQEFKTLFASTAAMQEVYNVASVHGGSHPTYGKDTIRGLDMDNSQSPRVPLLAAILRIADELSENPERVPELVAKHHSHSGESSLAFAYAKSFLPFELRKDNLFLTFGVYPSEASLTATVKRAKVSFLDFLEAKLDVIDREARYCSQYGRPAFSVGRIHVTIRLYEKQAPSPTKRTLSFSWPLLDGYPGNSEPIWIRSPELKDKGVRSLAECFAPSIAREENSMSRLRRFLGLRSENR